MEATLNICNLKFLQQFCKILGLSPYGVKRDVVERIAVYLQQQQLNVVPASVSASTITSEEPRRRCFGLFKNRKRQTNSLPNLTIFEEEEEDDNEYLLAEDHESIAAVAETTTPEAAAAAATEEIPLLNEKKSTVNYLCYSNFPQFFFIYIYIHLFVCFFSFSYFFSRLNALRYHNRC